MIDKETINISREFYKNNPVNLLRKYESYKESLEYNEEKLAEIKEECKKAKGHFYSFGYEPSSERDSAELDWLRLERVRRGIQQTRNKSYGKFKIFEGMKEEFKEEVNKILEKIEELKNEKLNSEKTKK